MEINLEGQHRTKGEAKSKKLVVVPKGKPETKTPTKSCDIKCFRCQGLGHSSSSSDDEIPPLMDYSDV